MPSIDTTKAFAEQARARDWNRTLAPGLFTEKGLADLRSLIEIHAAAVVACRTPELGGHVARCQDCGHTLISYNSCGNRHCPKCQGAAARQWLAEREAEPSLLSGCLPTWRWSCSPRYHWNRPDRDETNRSRRMPRAHNLLNWI